MVFVQICRGHLFTQKLSPFSVETAYVSTDKRQEVLCRPTLPPIYDTHEYDTRSALLYSSMKITVIHQFVFCILCGMGLTSTLDSTACLIYMDSSRHDKRNTTLCARHLIVIVHTKWIKLSQVTQSNVYTKHDSTQNFLYWPIPLTNVSSTNNVTRPCWRMRMCGLGWHLVILNKLILNNP